MHGGRLGILGPPAFVEGGDDARRADLVLQPAVQAMARVERIADQRQIPDLARRAVRAAHQVVVDDHAHADAGADRDEDHRGDASGQPEPLLAHGGEVDVVLDQHRQVKAVTDHFEGVEAALGNDVVGEGGDAPAALIDDARRGDPERQGTAVGGAGAIDHLADHLEHLDAHGAAAVLRRRVLEVADQLAEQVRGGDAHVAAADVAADHEPSPGADLVGHGLATPLTGAPAGRVHEAALLEPRDRGRDGRLRERGGGSDLRPGDRSLAEDRLQHRLLAEFAQEAQS